jgi:hypothetical protein
LACAGSWRVGLVWAVAAAAYVLVIDVVLARSMLEPGTVALAHQPLAGRLAVFMARAFNENVIYRLFWFSALMAGLRWIRPGATCLWRPFWRWGSSPRRSTSVAMS